MAATGVLATPSSERSAFFLDLEDGTSVWVEALHGQGNGIDLLDDLGADELPQHATGATRNENPDILFGQRECLQYVLEEMEDYFRLPGLVPLVVLSQNFVGLRVHNRRFDGGGTHVKPDYNVRQWVIGGRVAGLWSASQPSQKGLEQAGAGAI